jgi:hypothetical protein
LSVRGRRSAFFIVPHDINRRGGAGKVRSSAADGGIFGQIATDCIELHLPAALGHQWQT